MESPGRILSRFARVELEADLAALPADVRAALPALRRALDALHRIYVAQLDPALPAELDAVLAGPPGERRDFHEFFLGPWNPLDGDKPAFEGARPRLPGAAFYPADLSAEAFAAAVAAADPATREALLDHCTVVERGPGGRLRAVPYHERHAGELAPLAAALREAAGLVEHPGLRAYLSLRASSLLDGNYRAADEAWVRLRDAPVELVLGPYEVYADGLAGIKAAYEGMLFSVDAGAGEALAAIEAGLPAFAARFPLPAGSRGAVGGLAPMVVVDLLYSAGEARQGVMAAAFNLPNDTWVRGNVGWKQVMIRNVMRAKFENVSVPIARALSGGGASFEPFFHFILLHEVSHGLGPAFRADGSEVSASLGAAYTAIEEAKADVGALVLLLEEGGSRGVPRFPDEEILASYVAGLFRSMRFGLHEAHGAANVIEFNAFREAGVLSWEVSGSLARRPAGLRAAARGLLAELCRLEAEATPAEAAAYVARMGRVEGELEAAIARLDSIPTDIRPVFPLRDPAGVR